MRGPDFWRPLHVIRWSQWSHQEFANFQLEARQTPALGPRHPQDLSRAGSLLVVVLHTKGPSRIDALLVAVLRTKGSSGVGGTSWLRLPALKALQEPAAPLGCGSPH